MRKFLSREIPAYDAVTQDVLDAIRVNRTLYITGEFSDRPLFLTEITEGKYPNTYSIDSTRGGPAMKLTLPTEIKPNETAPHLIPGSLMYRKEYWDDSLTTSREAPATLRKAYQRILRTLKSCLVHRQTPPSNWVSSHASELLESGGGLILDQGKWWNGKGEAVKSNTRSGA